MFKARHLGLWGLAVLVVAFLALIAGADVVTLKDGTVLEGTVIKTGSGYWIKTTDGKTQTVPLSQVKSVESGSASAGSADLQATRRRVQTVDSALAAVVIWQKFLDSKPAADDEAAARKELAHWQKLVDQKAEKVNGKWMTESEYKEIRDKASKLLDESRKLMERNQTLDAVKKLEEANRTFPLPDVVFFLGFISLKMEKAQEAIRYFEQGLRIQPENTEALNNLGVAYILKDEYVRGMQLIYRAAKARDSRELAMNLVKAVSLVPSGQHNRPEYRTAEEAARLLASRYGIGAPSQVWTLLPPNPAQPKPPDKDDLEGAVASGTGFILTEDGLVLTNAHVVGKATATIMVMLSNGRRVSAEIVKIDEKKDLALIRLKGESRLPVAHLSTPQLPVEGALCYVLGYPMLDQMGANIKITQGIVSGIQAKADAEILTDAKVNPGNSGGPMVNAQGLVMGIVTLKTQATSMQESYGIAIGVSHIREFLDANKVKLPPAPATPSGGALSAEQVAAKLKPATVCIISVSGGKKADKKP